jgi:NarL family two-component system response regulator YdfI
LIRVLVVTTSALLRAGMESLVEVVGSAQNIAQAGSLVSSLHPDVIVVEWDSDQAQELIEFASEAPPMLVLAADPDPPWTGEALRGGVRGILPRDLSTGEILAAVEAAAAGLVVLHPHSVEAAMARPVSAVQSETLSAREIEVLRLMADGSSNKSIAWRLNISEHTVKFHINSIFSKMNAGSRTEAVTLGLRQGLIPL